MKRLLILLEAGDAYPSGKLRALQYVEHFRAAGYEPAFANRISPFIARLDESRSRALRFFRKSGGERFVRIMKRVTIEMNKQRALTEASKADFIYAVKVLDYRLLKKIRATSSAPIVVDIVDPVWLTEYDCPNLPELLSYANVVTTDNEWTAERLRTMHERVMIVPEAPQIELFDRLRARLRPREETVTIGWLGSPGTLCHLESILFSLSRIFERHPTTRFLALGAGVRSRKLNFDAKRCEIVPFYDERTMAAKVLEMDIGLYPMKPSLGAEFRGSLKSLNYMAGGAAVVASPVGESSVFIRDGENGLLADSPKEWEEKLARLVVDADERRRLSERALAEVRANHSRGRVFERIMEAFQRV